MAILGRFFEKNGEVFFEGTQEQIDYMSKKLDIEVEHII